MNSRYSILVLALATLTAPAALMAQDGAATAAPSTADTGSQYQTQQPAPVERNATGNNGNYDNNPGNNGYGRGPRGRQQQYYNQRPSQQPVNRIITTQPVPGVFARTSGKLDTVAAQPANVELRLTSGIANLNIHHPAKNSLIQVDMPGGKVNVLKDGLYTFNANTNTVRVLKGEAQTNVAGQAKPVKIKENHAFVFGGDNKSHDFYPIAARGDLLPMNGEERGEPAAAYSGYGPYAGYYGNPYLAYEYGYPYGYGWGYPYGYGIGLGFGFGGFGGYRGGFGGRGFRR